MDRKRLAFLAVPHVTDRLRPRRILSQARWAGVQASEISSCCAAFTMCGESVEAKLLCRGASIAAFGALEDVTKVSALWLQDGLIGFVGMARRAQLFEVFFP